MDRKERSYATECMFNRFASSLLFEKLFSDKKYSSFSKSFQGLRCFYYILEVGIKYELMYIIQHFYRVNILGIKAITLFNVQKFSSHLKNNQLLIPILLSENVVYMRPCDNSLSFFPC